MKHKARKLFDPERIEAAPLQPDEYPTPLLHSLPLRERPMQRVSNVGPRAMSLVELLAAIIGGPYQMEVAQKLVAQVGDEVDLANVPVEELARIPHLGPARAAALKAALELGSRLVQRSQPERLRVNSPESIANLLIAEMAHLEQEHFRVLYLDTRNGLLGSDTVYVGNLNATHIRVAEVFRAAIRRNCASLIAAHNHPSGDPTPSPDDIEVTRRLVAAGQMLDIEVADHLVIGRWRYVSLRERGLGF